MFTVKNILAKKPNKQINPPQILVVLTVAFNVTELQLSAVESGYGAIHLPAISPCHHCITL